jgi:hypothetical protein
MKKTWAILVLAGVCAGAEAAPRLIWQASIDNGATWFGGSGSGFKAMVGTTIKVRGVVDWTGTTAYGLSGLQQQIFIDNYDPGDLGAQIDARGVGNRVGPFNFGAATLSVRVTGLTERIVALGTTGAEGNIASGQPAPANGATTYSTANPALIFAFDYKVGAVHGRTLTIRSILATSAGVPSSMSFHSSQSSSSTSFRETGIVEPVSIEIIPDTVCTFSEQPQDAALLPGGSVTFSTAFPQPDAQYQWRRGGIALTESSRVSGTKSLTLVINDVRSEDQGAYDCVATSICNLVTTRQATLTCKTGFSDQPEGGTYPARDVIELHAATLQGSGVAVRWRKDGAVLFSSTIYSGVTTPTLTIRTTDPSQSGEYTLAATNACGTAVSASAEVVVYCPSDFNEDEFIDLADFDAFVASFEAGETSGDFNRDGFLTYVDFDEFVRAFESGC